jgi:diguanylate cyclase (GGDEF)-like protein
VAENVANVNRDVKAYHGRVEQVSQNLLAARSNAQDRPAESVLAAVSEILKINVGLQNRLTTAEERLRDQSEQFESLMAQACTDALTGVPNRRAFNDALERQVAASQRTGASFSVIFIDADHFKAINDRHGHAGGDFVLRRLAEVLEATFRKMDLVARIGGEEFAVLLPSTSGFGACRAAEHARLAVASHEFNDEDARIHVTVSLGVAAADPGDDANALLRRADQALYAAKQAGRNRTYFHDGTRCEPVDAAPSSAPAATPCAPTPPAAHEPETRDDADVAAVCHNLRQTAAQLVPHVA